MGISEVLAEAVVVLLLRLTAPIANCVDIGTSSIRSRSVAVGLAILVVVAGLIVAVERTNGDAEAWWRRSCRGKGDGLNHVDFGQVIHGLLLAL